MAAQQEKKGCYSVKTYTSYIYKWCPDEPTFTKIKSNKGQKRICTAIAGSQGDDFSCTYVYNISIVDGQQQRLAYVECDYVQ